MHNPRAAKHVLTMLIITCLALNPLGNSASANENTVITGQVVNGTTGEGSVAGLTILLHQVGMGEHVDSEATTNSQGAFQFAGISPVPGFVYSVSTEYRGSLYGQELDLATESGLNPIITVYETTDVLEVLEASTVSMLVTGIDQSGQWIHILEMTTILNSGERTYTPGPDPMKILRFGLPPGADDLRVQTNFAEGDILQVDEGFGLTASVPPGHHEVMFTYRFPYAGDSIQVTKNFLYGADQFQTLIVQDQVGITSSQMVGPAPINIGSLSYEQLSAHDIPKGASVTFALTGLPKASWWDHMSQALSTIPFLYVPPIVLVCISVIIIGYALLRRRERTLSKYHNLQSSLSSLERDDILQALEALEHRFEIRDINIREYTDERRSLLKHLLAVERTDMRQKEF